MAWKIDPTHSQIEFAVKHMMFTTVRGRFKSFEGTLNLDERNPAHSYVEGTIETASLDTQEANRDAHLRGADFFDAEQFPTMSFRSREIHPLGQERFQVVGEMTIKDVTRDVTFDVTYQGQGKDPWGNQRRGFSATTRLNRKDFGLNWNVALETGGWLVGEEVKVEIELQAVEEVAESAQA